MRNEECGMWNEECGMWNRLPACGQTAQTQAGSLCLLEVLRLVEKQEQIS